MSTKKKFIYIVSAISGVIVLCYLFMVLLLPLFINKEGLKAKIALVLSQKISGEVQFQAMDISFFPLPHVRIGQLNIHFSNGNKVSIASLEIFPSIFRLLSGDIRISKIHAHSPEISIAYTRKQEPLPQEEPELKLTKLLDDLSSLSPDFTVSIRNGILNLTKGPDSILSLKNIDSDISLDKNGLELDMNVSTAFSKNISGKGIFPISTASSKNFILDLEAKDINLSLAKKTAISLIGENQLVNTIFSYIKKTDIPSLSFRSQGSSFEDLWKLDNILIKGHLENATIFIPGLQFEFIEAAGNCTLSRGVLKADKLEGKLETAQLQNGSLKIGLKGNDAPFHFAIDTKMDSNMVSRLLKQFLKEPPFPLNSLQIINSPVEGRIVLGESTAIFKGWKNKGIFAFNGAINVNSGPEIYLDIAVNPKEINIRGLDIQDNSSDAEFRLSMKQNVVSLQFKGTLTADTIRKLFRISSFYKGSLRAKFDATIDTENATQSMASGYLSAQNISFLLKNDLPVNIKQIYLNSIRNRINVESAILNISDTPLTTKGTIDLTSKGIKADMDITSEALHWKTVQELISSDQKASQEKKKEPSQRPVITGELRVKANNFLFDSTSISQVKANISLLSDSVHISVNEASLCGISMPGAVDIKNKNIILDFALDAQQKDLKPVLSCLTNERSVISGTFNVESTVKSESKPETLIKSATGSIHIISKNGRIYKGTMFPKIFSILNVTGIFEGGFTDLTKSGFGYNSILINADIKNGYIVLTKAVMDAPSMTMVCTGNIDITKKRYNLKILASPLKTVDSIVGKIPLIRDITGGSLISVPISVTGDLKNPTVNYLPVSSVGSGLMGIMENTIKLPVKIFQPSSQK